MSINGHVHSATIDTAAQVSCVKESIARSIIFGPFSKPRALSSADGMPMEVLGSIGTVLEIEGELLNAELQVLPKLQHDILLGIDILRKLPFSLLLKTGGIYHNTKNQKTSTMNSSNNNFVEIKKKESHIGSSSKGKEKGSPRELPSSCFPPNISHEEKRKLENLMLKYQELLQEQGGGVTNRARHQIVTDGSSPPYQHPYRMSSPKQDFIRQEVQRLLQEQKIRPSNSPYGAPVVLPLKKNGQYRFAVDYRRLNKITRKDGYPLPRIDDLLDQIRGAQYFSIVDARAGYHQVPMEERDISKTAFVTSDGQYEWLVMPFGLCNAPGTFQRLMNDVLQGLYPKECVVYIDDVLVFGHTFEEMAERLNRVLHRLAEAKIQINFEKSHLGMKEVEFLGHVVSGNGIRPNPNKLEAVEKYPDPKSKEELLSFLGLCGYFNKFIPNFAELAYPLRLLTRKNSRWAWNDIHTEACRRLKNVLTSAPVLAHYHPQRHLHLFTDASGHGLGATLLQVQEDGAMKPIGFASRLLSSAETNYSTTEKEALALQWAVTDKFHVYLEGHEFTVHTDHAPLCGELKLKRPSTNRLARIILKLQSFVFKVIHEKGKENKVADALSRMCQVNEISLSVEQECDPILQKWRLILRKHPQERTKEEKSSVQNMVLQNNVLYRNHQLVLPRGHQLEEVRRVHRRGHPGFARTLATLQERFWWPTMNKDVNKVIQTCDKCLRYNPPRGKKPGFLLPVTAPYAMHSLGIDFTGPFDGGRHIIVAVDIFSRFVFAQECSSQSAIDAIRFLKKTINTFGCPVQVITDNAKVFRSKTFEEFLKDLKIRHVFTSVGRPQGNGTCERVQQTLIRMLSKAPRTGSWTNVLQEAVDYYNGTVHTSLGVSPRSIMFQRQVRNPEDNLYETGSRSNHSSASPLTNNRRRNRERQYNKKRSRRVDLPQVGHPVLVRNFNRRKAKLDEQFVGPFKVQGRINERCLRVNDRNINIDQIRKIL